MRKSQRALMLRSKHEANFIYEALEFLQDWSTDEDSILIDEICDRIECIVWPEEEKKDAS